MILSDINFLRVPLNQTKKIAWVHYLLSVLLIALVTLLGEFIKRYLEPANLVMLYLLGVVVIAVRFGRGPAIVSCLLSVLAFDFFLIRPYFTLAVEDWQYLVTFFGFLVVAFLISEWTIKVREQVQKDRQLELLRETEKLHTALLNSISHDLRTPLSSIIGTLSVLLQSEPSLDPASIRELLSDASEEAYRLNRIVGNLIDMAQMEGGRLKMTPKLCELRDVIGFSLQELKAKTQHRQIKVQIASDFPEILMDFSWIAKVFVNLLDNALKYSPSNSEIHIQASSESHQIRIAISNEAPSFSSEDLKSIFNKFQRGPSPRSVKGLGLGLSICKGIIEAHHGSIAAEYRDGKISFVIFLPRPGTPQ